MKKYIVFDFDGTLVNTNDVVIASWQATYEHFYGRPGDVKRIKESFGETLKYTASVDFAEFSETEVLETYRNYQIAHCDELVTLFDGIHELLEELKARGYKMAVATSRVKKSYFEYMDKFDLRRYIDVSVTMEDVSRFKPDPETLQVALDKLGAKPEEAVMLGDTRFDMGCANNAGVDSILVAWSDVTSEEILIEAGYPPKYVIDRPADLLSLLERIDG